jgi:RNA polymerase sigma factor (TIGR02999 family)
VGADREREVERILPSGSEAPAGRSGGIRGRGHCAMSTNPRGPTELLLAWRRGDQRAFDELVPLVHDELRRRARQYMAREQAGHTLQATALVNEAYLQLIELKHIRWQDRAHFFAMAARMMRRILVDFARARRNEKRGGEWRKVSLQEALLVSADAGQDLVALDEALSALEAAHPRKSQVVELRFFGGLSIEETAEALQVSIDTVKRDWRFAKLWLLRELARTPSA